MENNRIDEILKEFKEILAEEEAKQKEAVEIQETAEILKTEAIKTEAESKERTKAIQEAKEKVEAAKDAYYNVSEGEKAEIKETEVKEVKTKDGFISGLVIGALAVAVAVTGYVVVRDVAKKKVKEIPNRSMTANDTINNDLDAVISENTVYDSRSNEVVITEAPVEDTIEVIPSDEPEYLPVVTPESEVVESNEELTTEAFENLVANYSNKYSDQYSIVATEDVTKFAAIANIDILAEQNPELLREIAGVKTKEEFLNDAAKLIGLTDMYNSTVWMQTNSTEGFIKISDIIYGEQKEQMIKIEAYIDEIGAAVNQEDADLVNSVVSEFILDLNSGELSKLDDGVGFVAASYLLTMSDTMAKDYLNKQNFDMLQVLKTSEKFVSNIFTVYDRCLENAKTYTR